MESFAECYEIKRLLGISKRHLDAIDRSRIIDGHVIGQDNFDTLAVSTIFAAIAIEAALNEYVLSHCLFLDIPHLQNFFGTVMKNFLRSGMHNKLSLLKRTWSQKVPKDLMRNVEELIRIRNRIAHQQGVFTSANEAPARRAYLSNDPLQPEEYQHMLRHYEIAREFLTQFYYPGNQELQQEIADEKSSR